MKYTTYNIRRLLTLIITFAAVNASAATRSITGSDGLGDLLVNAICKDYSGYIWLGTGSTLDRFDGNTVRSYSIPGDDPLLKRINCIASTPDGTVYAGNRSGLLRLAPGADSPEHILATEITFTVNDICADPGRRLYLATAHGLYIYDTADGRLRRELIQSDILSKENDLSAIAIDAAGRLWVTTATALYRLDPAGGTTEAFRFPFPSSHCTDIERRGDRLYIATLGSGVITFDTATRSFGPVIHAGNDLVSDIDLRGDTLYIATDGEGVFTCDTASGAVSQCARAGRLRSGSVYSLLADDRGLLWVGYYQGGADYTPYVDDLFHTYRMPDGLWDEPSTVTVRSLCIRGDKRLIGTREGLFYINDRTGVTRHFSVPQIQSNLIFAIRWWAGRYWIGTYGGGLHELDPATLTVGESALARDILSGHTVFSLTVDRHGDMWAGTSAGLLRLSAGKVAARYTSESSPLPAGNVYEVYFDSRDRGWICTESGMAVLRDGKLSTDGFPAGFVNRDKIRCVYEDSDHRLYFLPDRGRMLRSDLSLTDFSRMSFGAGNATMATFAVEDADGSLWVGTDKGLLRYESDSQIHIYNKADGLPGTIFTLCQPAVDSRGDIWLGNSDGLVRIDRRRIAEQHRRPASFAVTDVEINGRSVASRFSADRTITLDEDENNLTVYFSDFSYADPADLLAECRLDGYDDDWQLIQGRGKVTYYGLEPGRYALHLRSPGAVDSGVALEMRVDDRVNWLMWILFALALVAAGIAVMLWLKHRRKSDELRRHREQEQAALELKKQNMYKTTRLTAEECQRIRKALERVMADRRPFTDPNLKISALAQMIGVTAHDMSYFFNQYLERSYYDYINEYRVAEFKAVAARVDTSRYTLSAMAQMCGFSSRASFFRHFKAATGITPAEYLKRQS